MYEKRQNGQTTDLFLPLCVKLSCRAAARLGKFFLIGDWIAVGGSAALRISHALWVNNLSPLSILPIFLQDLDKTEGDGGCPAAVFRLLAGTSHGKRIL
ncbi:MAG: hypothetical protein OSJ58_02480 [Dysosmobacter sp.]|nr:hypothetical protein [Dysosmobacter sp.]